MERRAALAPLGRRQPLPLALAREQTLRKIESFFQLTDASLQFLQLREPRLHLFPLRTSLTSQEAPAVSARHELSARDPEHCDECEDGADAERPIRDDHGRA